MHHHVPLSAMDEFPVHQIAEPVRHVGPSDRHFYDRWYFNCHPSNTDLFVIFGMGQYPNLGVQDAFAAVRRDDLHRVVRASRPLEDRGDLSVGPFSVEVVKGLETVRFTVGDNPHGLSLDLTWNGAVPAFAEEPHRIRRHGRVIFDTMRFAQLGCWTGHITIGDERFEVTPDHWWGSRDRSWGVRPVGEPEPQGIQDPTEDGFLWDYTPMQFDDHAILSICQERSDGSRVMSSAVRVWADGTIEDLGDPQQQHVLISGSRDVASSTLSFPDAPGGPIEIEAELLVPVWLQAGTGYGRDPEWTHGMYQGPELVVQGVDYSVSGDRDHMWGICDASARYHYEGPDGTRTGYGLFEYMFLGEYPKYGLTGLLDPAP